jgi:uncharacterized protein (DUF433 family)
MWRIQAGIAKDRCAFYPAVMDYIEATPGVMMGKPVIAGTRVTVENILERLGGGESVESIVAGHPRLTRAAVLAAVGFGAKALRADVVYPTPHLAA